MNVFMNVMISQLIENKVLMYVINKSNMLMKFISYFYLLKENTGEKMSQNVCNDGYHNSYTVIKTEHF